MNYYKQPLLYLLFFAPIFLPACKNKGNNNTRPDTLPDSAVLINNITPSPSTVRKNAYADVDVSPMDMCYYPQNYPQLKMTNPKMAPPVMRLIYSRPHLQHRKLFHDILKYGEPWRMGANEATELNVFQPVKLNNKTLATGRYSIYCIPQDQYWTIAINSNLDTWGLKIDATKDVVRAKIPVTHNNPHLEYLTMMFEKNGEDVDLVIGWGDVVAKLPFQL